MACWLTLSTLVILIHCSQALFFGGGSSSTGCGQSCIPACSGCSSGGSFGGGYSGQYGQPGHTYGGIPQSQSYNYPISQPSQGYSISQPSQGYASVPIAPIAPIVPQFQQALPPLISPSFYQTGQAPINNYQNIQPQQNIAPPPENYQESNVQQPAEQNFPTYTENNQPENVESRPAPQQVQPTKSYLDVDVSSTTSGTTYGSTVSPPGFDSGYGEQIETATQSPSTQTTSQPVVDQDQNVDYLEPTNLPDPLSGSQNNDQPLRSRTKKTKVQGIKTFTDPTRCNNDDLQKIMEENITVSPSIAKRRIQEAASKKFNGTFDVICSYDNFSYLANTQLFCELKIRDIICFAFLHKFN